MILLPLYPTLAALRQLIVDALPWLAQIALAAVMVRWGVGRWGKR